MNKHISLTYQCFNMYQANSPFSGGGSLIEQQFQPRGVEKELDLRQASYQLLSPY